MFNDSELKPRKFKIGTLEELVGLTQGDAEALARLQSLNRAYEIQPVPGASAGKMIMITIGAHQAAGENLTQATDNIFALLGYEEE